MNFNINLEEIGELAQESGDVGKRVQFSLNGIEKKKLDKIKERANVVDTGAFFKAIINVVYDQIKNPSKS